MLPFGLSKSYGVIGGLAFALPVSMLINIRSLKLRLSSFPLLVGFGVFVVFALLSSTSVSERLYSILGGADSSGSVRIFQSNYVAFKIAEETSLFFGSGFGQAKFLAGNYFSDFWLNVEIIRLANAVAATLAEFGIFGIAFRFFVEIVLFFRSRVYNSIFRSILFIFLFVYQFTGSYTTNFAEYIIWILAFVPVFSEFEKMPRNILRWNKFAT